MSGLLRPAKDRDILRRVSGERNAPSLFLFPTPRPSESAIALIRAIVCSLCLWPAKLVLPIFASDNLRLCSGVFFIPNLGFAAFRLTL